MYKIRILDEAIESLKNLDKAVSHRIVRKITWLHQNFELIQHKGLRNNLAGLNKLREGDYRIIYQVIEDESIIIIHFVGHRREIYKI
jgi:mRNA interferase RelE/StbE